MEGTMNELTRRSFVKTAAYVAPVILTLKARPAHASLGSGHFGNADAQLRRDVERFVADLRKAERGKLSEEERVRLARQAREWQDAGIDKRIQSVIDQKIVDLKKSGNRSAANQLKAEVAHLLKLATQFLRL